MSRRFWTWVLFVAIVLYAAVIACSFIWPSNGIWWFGFALTPPLLYSGYKAVK